MTDYARHCMGQMFDAIEAQLQHWFFLGVDVTRARLIQVRGEVAFTLQAEHEGEYLTKRFCVVGPDGEPLRCL